MKKHRSKIAAELYNIYSDMFHTEAERATAINDSLKAFAAVRRDALFRKLNSKHYG